MSGDVDVLRIVFCEGEDGLLAHPICACISSI